MHRQWRDYWREELSLTTRDQYVIAIVCMTLFTVPNVCMKSKLITVVATLKGENVAHELLKNLCEHKSH